MIVCAAAKLVSGPARLAMSYVCSRFGLFAQPGQGSEQREGVSTELRNILGGDGLASEVGDGAGNYMRITS